MTSSLVVQPPECQIFLTVCPPFEALRAASATPQGDSRRRAGWLPQGGQSPRPRAIVPRAANRSPPCLRNVRTARPAGMQPLIVSWSRAPAPRRTGLLGRSGRSGPAARRCRKQSSTVWRVPCAGSRFARRRDVDVRPNRGFAEKTFKVIHQSALLGSGPWGRPYRRTAPRPAGPSGSGLADRLGVLPVGWDVCAGFAEREPCECEVAGFPPPHGVVT